MLALLGSLLAALLSWWRGRDTQKEEQSHAIESQRAEAKDLASPARDWHSTVDAL